MYMKTEAAKERLAAFLTGLLNREVLVVYWPWEHTACGVRISEVTIVTARDEHGAPMAGTTWGQHDGQYAAQVIHYCERLVLAYINGENPGWDPDAARMGELMLRKVFFGPTAEAFPPLGKIAQHGLDDANQRFEVIFGRPGRIEVELINGHIVAAVHEEVAPNKGYELLGEFNGKYPTDADNDWEK